MAVLWELDKVRLAFQSTAASYFSHGIPSSGCGRLCCDISIYLGSFWM